MVVSCSYSMDSHKLFHEANDLFINKKYKKSIELYEKIIDSGQENSTVFYNLEMHITGWRYWPCNLGLQACK